MSSNVQRSACGTNSLREHNIIIGPRQVQYNIIIYAQRRMVINNSYGSTLKLKKKITINVGFGLAVGTAVGYVDAKCCAYILRDQSTLYYAMYYVQQSRPVPSFRMFLFSQYPQILVQPASDEYGQDHDARPGDYRQQSRVHRLRIERPALSGHGQ